MLYDTLLKLGDFLLTWTLRLPGDLPIVALAALTSLALVGAQKIAGNSDWLRRLGNDRRRLRDLARRAKAAGDRDALRRHRAVLGEIALRIAVAEFRTLLAALPLLVLLGLWGCERLACYPSAPGEAVEVKLYYPLPAVGQLVHIVPVEGIQSENGWIRKFALDNATSASAVASWRLTAERSGQYSIVFVSSGHRDVHSWGVGGASGGKCRIAHSADKKTISEINLRPRRLLGWVPGIPAIGLDDWMTGYLILAVLLFLTMKRFLPA